MKHPFRLFVIAVLAAALPACSDSPKAETSRQALERLAPSRAALTLQPTPTPSAYRVTLDRITAASTPDDDGLLRTESIVRTVRRPFVLEEQNGLRRRLGFEQDSSTSIERASFFRPLPDDGRADVYPPDAARDANRARSVAGATCRVYVYDEAEYCINGSGLVVASLVGSTVEVATKITDLGAAPTAVEIAVGLSNGVSDKARGSVRPVDPTTTPPGRTDWSLAAPPDGFAFVGRYTSVPLSSEVLTEGSTAILASVVDVYVRGVDTVVVDRGGKLNLSEVTEKDLGALVDAQELDLGALGKGIAGIGGIGPFGYREVRAFPEKGRFVVVAGTLPVEQLEAIARALRPSPGTTLRYLDQL